jgi:alginate O-acetyltransferase complex protein AlgI
MDLASPKFLFLFLPVFLIVYTFSRQNLRYPLVLAGSIVFLTVGQPLALVWLGTLLLVGYLAGRLISSTENKTSLRARVWFFLGISTNLALLFFFKYLNAYGAESLTWMHLPANWTTALAGLATPLGLSYVTFQMISYIVDVWKGSIPAERDFLKLATYILFFPKLLSGPLVRYKAFRDQLDQLDPSSEEIASGIRRLLTGFAKRVLIANQLALFANAAFDLPSPNFTPQIAWLALAAYSFQIYFDFSGFIDIALGLALMIGIRLPENFNFPYTAQSISDFWRRWHITLTTWFREYVFYPLERHRFKFAGQQINILIVFILTGLWHGFQPTFIIWGLLHGVAMALESAGLGRTLKTLWRPLRHLYTLSIVTLSWIFFRSNSLDYSLAFIARLAGDKTGITPLPFMLTKPLPFIEPSFLLALAAAVLFSLPLAERWNLLRTRLENKKSGLFFLFQPLEDLLLVALFILGLALIFTSTFAPNIYAKF